MAAKTTAQRKRKARATAAEPSTTRTGRPLAEPSKETGRRPGAQPGNNNAQKHGAYLSEKRAEKKGERDRYKRRGQREARAMLNTLGLADHPVAKAAARDLGRLEALTYRMETWFEARGWFKRDGTIKPAVAKYLDVIGDKLSNYRRLLELCREQAASSEDETDFEFVCVFSDGSAITAGSRVEPSAEAQAASEGMNEPEAFEEEEEEAEPTIDEEPEEEEPDHPAQFRRFPGGGWPSDVPADA